jgi:hypothetical protein
MSLLNWLERRERVGVETVGDRSLEIGDGPVFAKGYAGLKMAGGVGVSSFYN